MISEHKSELIFNLMKGKPMERVDFNFGERDSCPTSTHSKKMHRGATVTRKTIIKELPMWGKANKGKTFKSTSYVDHLKCVHCGAEFDQEWMPAGI